MAQEYLCARELNEQLTVSRELFPFECDFYNNRVFLLSRHSHGLNLIQAVENSLEVLRRAQDERSVFDILDDFRSAEALEAFRIFFRQPIYGRYSDQVPEVAHCVGSSPTRVVHSWY